MPSRACALCALLALALLVGACKSDGAATAPPKTAEKPGAEPDKPAGAEWPERPSDGAPVVVQFVAVDRTGDDPRATMHVFNFADAAIRGIHMELEYVGKDGAVLKTFPWSQVGPDLVPAKAHALQQMGAFLPDETETVRARVHRVELGDGTEWRRGEP